LELELYGVGQYCGWSDDGAPWGVDFCGVVWWGGAGVVGLALVGIAVLALVADASDESTVAIDVGIAGIVRLDKCRGFDVEARGEGFDLGNRQVPCDSTGDRQGLINR
jgi:hypothetical protein